MVELALNGLIVVLGTVISLLLTFILSRLSKIEGKLDLKVNKEDCRETRATCAGEIKREVEHTQACKKEEHIEIWDAFNGHSHTGLPSDSKVTR